MRISDWSSDVCSSDLYGVLAPEIAEGQCNTFDPETGTFGEVQSLLDENNVAWRAALDWSPNDDTLLYASVSRGYKAGTTPINAANLARQNAPVTQEKLTARSEEHTSELKSLMRKSY